MARKYDSSRREEAAEKTRQTIIETAFGLHGRGIADYETLAAEANVSLATVRKHFPNRELLFENCTAWGLHHAPVPDLEQLARTESATDRMCSGLAQVYALYESIFGQMWWGYVYVHESPVMQRVMAEGEEMVDQTVDLVMEPWGSFPGDSGEARGYVRGLFSFFTYYALRHDGGLSPEQTTGRITEALLQYLERVRGSKGR